MLLRAAVPELVPPPALTAELASLQAAREVHHCASKLKVWPRCQVESRQIICRSISSVPSGRSTQKCLITQAEIILGNNHELCFND